MPPCLPAWSQEDASLPLPPMLIGQALATAREQGLEPQDPMALPGGLTLRLALPPADSCSPSGAWLLCPGWRLVSAGPDADAPLMAIWSTRILPEPLPRELLRDAALARLGPPGEEEMVLERRRGLDLPMLRLAWRLPGPPALRLEVRYVLEETSLPGPAPRVLRVAWSAEPEGAARLP
ncbi:hypothetical protein ACVFYP_09155 [Roseomonas sp. F4]